MKKKILEFQNLSISFQKNQQVVNNLSFSLYEKETLALVGESGSGKSVTALASMKLLPSNAKTEGLINFENKKKEEHLPLLAIDCQSQIILNSYLNECIYIY